MKYVFPLLFLLTLSDLSIAQSESTFAEKLGYPKGAKVIILHVDDMGMSYDSNLGGLEAMTKGVANSCSVMMPCPWVPGFVHALKQYPKLDAGLHLTLNAEWKDYRWGPLSGKTQVPGLTDSEGAMWRGVGDVVKHATADEVETEIRAQVERARTMGFEPTHLDSHMGTIFASPAFMERYIKVGIEYQIPVMFPGGHNTLIAAELKNTSANMQMARSVGKKLWEAGLPVLDDLYNDSYSWKPSPDIYADDQRLQAYKTAKYIDVLKSLKPGITMIIMHCTNTTEVFKHISDSGPTRRGDYLAMMDPKLKQFIEKEGIILTTWREMMERRRKILL
ncbi:MAG: polysaccharide deacetylase family protein [Chitinophagaceae bacterium]|nr:polysaccharide deacetylase family protein [Chitinophagaceae bacterium]